MEITIEINEWGLGLYSPWAGFDFTWGFAITAAILIYAIRYFKKYPIKLPRFLRRIK